MMSEAPSEEPQATLSQMNLDHNSWQNVALNFDGKLAKIVSSNDEQLDGTDANLSVLSSPATTGHEDHRGSHQDDKGDQDACHVQPCPVEAGCNPITRPPWFECICHDLLPVDPVGHHCVRSTTPAIVSNDTESNSTTTTNSPPGAIHVLPGNVAPRPEGSTLVPQLTAHSGPLGGSEFLLAAALALGAVFALSVILLAWKRKRFLGVFMSSTGSRRRGGGHRRSGSGYSGGGQSGVGSQPPSKGTLQKCIQQYVTNPNYHPGDSLDKLIGEIEIPSDQVTFLNEIGEGCFGKVYKGEYIKNEASTSTVASAAPLAVAIKVLKSGLSQEAEADFEKEIEILSSFSHPNIVRLLGVVRQGKESPVPAMIFEFMELGDLAELLRSKATRGPGLTDKCEGQLSKVELVWVVAQIASGMFYLSSQHFVHRDLATRNCLVGEGLAVKISDFGMSRDIYTCDYYKVSGSKMLPVRWMSPESILYGKFTLESDVWSFGVVLWEVFTFAKQPYYGHSNEEVVKLILQGILLIPPENCPQFIYSLMAATWKSEAKDRISFRDILDKFLEEVSETHRATLRRSHALAHNGPRRRSQMTIDQGGDNGGDDGQETPLDEENYLVPSAVVVQGDESAAIEEIGV